MRSILHSKGKGVPDEVLLNVENEGSITDP